MALPSVVSTTSANWAAAFPYNHSFTHDATGAEALLAFVTTAGGYAWDPTATFNGASMTLLTRTNSSGGQGTIWVFGLNAPAQSSGTVQIQRRTAGDGGSSDTTEYADIGVTTVIGLSGTDPTAPFNAYTSAFASSAPSLQLTTTGPNCLLIAGGHNHYTSGASPGLTFTGAATTAVWDNGTSADHRQKGVSGPAAYNATYSVTATAPFNVVCAGLVAVKGTGGAFYSATTKGLFGTSGLTLISPASANQDDGSTAFALGHSFSYLGTSYSDVYVGSNTYLTWGAGSTSYNLLSGAVPNVPTMFFGASDHSYQRLYHGTAADGAKLIRYEGTASTSGTAGSPTIVIEWYIYPTVNGVSRMMAVVGDHGRAASGSLWGWQNGAGTWTTANSVSNASTAFPNFQLTSYTYESTDNGTTWLVRQGSFSSEVEPPSTKTITQSAVLTSINTFGASVVSQPFPQTLAQTRHVNSPLFGTATVGWTRFYLPSAGTAGVTPITGTGWEQAPGYIHPLTRTRTDTPLTNRTVNDSVATNNRDICVASFVSEPLVAQTITGRVRAILRAYETATGANFFPQMMIRVVSGNGQTVRGTLLAQENFTGTTGSEFGTTLTNRKFPRAYTGTEVSSTTGAALTSVTAQAGDRLVVEIGIRANNAVTTSFTGVIDFGDPIAGSLLVENETGTAAGVPWIEFTDQIVHIADIPTVQTLVQTVHTDDDTFPVGAVEATAVGVTTLLQNGFTDTSTFGTAAIVPPTAPQTRFYFPSSGDAPVAVALDASWDGSVGLSRKPLSRTRTGTALTEILVSEFVAGAGQDVPFCQFVSEPLAAQTISGSVRGMMRCRELLFGGENAVAQLVVRVVSKDGTTVRGYLVQQDPHTGTTGEFDFNALQARKFPRAYTGTGPGTGVVPTPLAVLDGDRLVVEIGARFNNVVNTGDSASGEIGDPLAGDDISELETTNSTSVPWIEISQVVVFQPTLTPALFGDADSFGVGSLEVAEGGAAQTLTATNHSDDDAFGSSALAAGAVTLTGTNLDDADIFGTASAAPGARTITGALYSDSEAFGSSTASPGPVASIQTGFSDADSFGTTILAAGPVTLVTTRHEDADTFGTSSAYGTISVAQSGFADDDAFGTASLYASIALNAILHADNDDFGTAALATSIALGATLHADADTSGTAVVSAGPVTLTAVLLNDTDSFGFASLTAAGTGLTGSLLIDEDTFGTAAVTAGAVTVAGTSHSDGDTFGVSSLAASISLVPTVLIDGDSFGTTAVQPQAVTLSPAVLADGDAFGVNLASPGPLTLAQTGFADADAFGTGSISAGGSDLAGSLLIDEDVFVAAAVTAGTVTLQASPFAAVNSFGSAAIAASIALASTLHTDISTFGGSLVTAGAVTLTGNSISDADGFGTAVLAVGAPGAVTLLATGFTGNSTFGAAVVTPGPVAIEGAHLADGDAIGQGSLDTISGLVQTGFASTNSFGSGSVTPGAVTAVGSRYSDEDAFGVSMAFPGAVGLQASSFADADAFGLAGATAILDLMAEAPVSGTVFGISSLDPGAVEILAARYDDADLIGMHALTTGALALIDHPGALSLTRGLAGISATKSRAGGSKSAVRSASPTSPVLDAASRSPIRGADPATPVFNARSTV